MGKKSRKQRRERKTARSIAEHATEILKRPNPMFTGLSAEVDPSLWLISWTETEKPKPERKSTLSAAYTDLLKVEAPRARRYTMIPPHARSRPVEDFLEFHKSASAPKRIGNSLEMGEPPLAMVCPECSVRRPFSFGRGFSFFGEASGFDACKYCGVHLTVHGTRLMWWR